MSEVLVIGHRNPDTDSICSAIGYAEFKRRTGMPEAVAARCGDTNERIDFVLENFGMPAPKFVSDVSPRVRDVMARDLISVASKTTVAEALGIMEDRGIRVLPVLNADKTCEGLLSLFKMSKFFFPAPNRPFDSRKVVASLLNLACTLDAEMIYAVDPDREEELILMIGAMTLDAFTERVRAYERQKLIVIVGDRRDIQSLAIREKVRVIVVTGGLPVDAAIIEEAKRNKVSLLTSPHDSATTAMLSRASISVDHMIHRDFLSFRDDEELAAVKGIAGASNFQAFPVVDDKRRTIGILSKSDFLKKVDRKLILVDHNELSQAVHGAENVEILEVVDHHRIGLTTQQPILFRNEPVGSTSTIVARCFIHNRIDMPDKIAGILLAGIVSDTLNLTSPTTTQVDRDVLAVLEVMAGVNAKEFTERLFASGSVLVSRPASQAVTTDCKEYIEQGRRFSVAQIEEIGFTQFWNRKNEVVQAVQRYCAEKGYYMAALLVLLFMRNWRATVIAAVAIPCSVIATFAMMKALNFTLNSVTMLALVLMVGIVIDDAIVVLENIFRWIEEKQLEPFEAAKKATAEIGLAVMATTLSLVVIFVPVSFMSSISGRFLYQFGITAAVAVLVSLLVSFTLTPMMSARLFRRGAGHGNNGPQSRGGFYARIENWYLRTLGFALRHRVATAVLALAVIASSVPLYKSVRQEYTPGNTDEGEFEIRLSAPEGTAVQAMNEAAEAVEKEIETVPGVRLVLASAGGGGFMGSVNQARFFVRLAPHDERLFTLERLWNETRRGRPLAAFDTLPQSEVVQEVRKRLRKFSGLRASISNVGGFSFGGGRWDIDFVILGPDLETLASYAEKLRKRAPEIGVVDADTTLKLDKPELRVEIDRERAAALGVETEDIASALRIMVGGDDRASRFYDATVNDSYDVQIRLKGEQRQEAAEIARLFVPNREGGLVRLDNLVKLVPATTASRIDRLDRQRQVSLRAGVAPGYALADRLEALKEEAKALNLPLGYTTRIAGKGRELDATFREFLGAFALSVIFMYMILASQFESVVHPFTILLSLPVCVPFALFSLWVTDSTLNLYSALGLLVLFGVVKKNAILQIDHMIKLEDSGLEPHAAILQANRDRLRPILMTTLTLVAGMLPLALGNGPGAEERRSIAVLVIGGQSLALLLTLIITPVAYSVFEDLRNRRRGLPKTKSGKSREAAELEPKLVQAA